MALLLEQFVKYLVNVKKYSNHSIKAYRSDLLQLKKFVEESFSIHSWNEITIDHLRDWQVNLFEAKMTGTTIRRKISAVKNFYKYLLASEQVITNPAQDLIIPKVRKPLPKIVSSEYILQALERMKGDDSFEGRRDYLIVLLLYTCGLRREELINITDENFEIGSEILRVLGKGNKERLIPIEETLIRQIKSYIDIRNEKFGRSDFDYLLVTNKGDKMYPKLVYNTVKENLSDLSKGEVHPHILRHSFATHLLENGAKIEFVKSLLGHSNLAATQVYTHLSMEHILTEYNKAHPRS